MHALVALKTAYFINSNQDPYVQDGQVVCRDCVCVCLCVCVCVCVCVRERERDIYIYTHTGRQRSVFFNEAVNVKTKLTSTDGKRIRHECTALVE